MSSLLTRREGDILLVYFEDVSIIDEANINELGHEFLDLLNQPDNEKIVVNLENVGFMSSAMIGKLILFAKECKAGKVRLRLCKINENLQQVFDLMNLHKVFLIDKEESVSIAQLNKKTFL